MVRVRGGALSYYLHLLMWVYPNVDASIIPFPISAHIVRRLLQHSPPVVFIHRVKYRFLRYTLLQRRSDEFFLRVLGSLIKRMQAADIIKNNA